jgi:NADH-quinone oxidoreductase subunit I
MIARVKQYSANIGRAASTIFEGMAVTLSYMVRKPMTVQYPDRVEKPVKEMLPERYRGFLEVDMAICGACQACARNCPIECIAIDMEKHPEHKRVMTRFDIDIAKCMYCGICTEVCPEGAIRHTPEFEAGTANLSNLVFRFVEGDFVVPAKMKKGEKPETVPIGSIASKLIRGWNAPAPELPELPAEEPKPDAEERKAARKARAAAKAAAAKAAQEANGKEEPAGGNGEASGQEGKEEA